MVVEGYTDVMAAHLSGVDTAVASCGTAFGDDHARLLRRLMGDHDAFHGEVIFTFDGDPAGQNAALKVFAGDQNFITQTYVAVEPTGLDPCDLRLQHGDAAVRELVARRMPLYRFVMSNMLQPARPRPGRRSAGRPAGDRARWSAASATPAWSTGTRASWPGCSGWTWRRSGPRCAGRVPVQPAHAGARGRARAGRPPAGPTGMPMPDPRDRLLAIERETAKLLIQAPQLFPTDWDGLSVADFTHPAYAAVFTAVEKAAAAGAGRGLDAPGRARRRGRPASARWWWRWRWSRCRCRASADSASWSPTPPGCSC